MNSVGSEGKVTHLVSIGLAADSESLAVVFLGQWDGTQNTTGRLSTNSGVASQLSLQIN